MKGPYILLLNWNCLPGDDICIFTNRCLISLITWNINRAQRLWVCVCVFHVLPTQHWEHGALKRGAMGAISLPLRCQGGNFHHLGQIRRGFLEPRKWHQVTNNKCNIQAELKPMNTLSKHREEAKKKAQCWWRGKLGQLAELRMCTGSSGGSLVLNGKLRNWALIHHQVMVKS